MSDIRDYLKEREGGYREKIRMHRRGKLRLACILAGTVLFVFLACFLYHTLRTYKTYTVKNVVERTESALSVTLQIGEHMVSYSKDGASCVDKQGNKVWNQTYEMQKPIAGYTKKSIAIADYNGRNIYVMDADKILGTIATNMPVKNVAVAGNGIVAAILEDGNTTWINVYDTDGNVLVYSKTKMNNSGYPVAVALSPDATLMAVSYLYVDSGVIRTGIGFYNFGEVGQNELHNYVSGFNYVDSVVPYLRFINNETAVAVADDRIMFYRGEQKPSVFTESLISRQILSVYQGGEYTGLVYENTEGETAYYMDLYNGNGEKERTLEFDCEYSDIVISEKTILIYNKNEWNVYTIKGRKKFSGTYESNIQRIVPAKNIADYLIVTERTMETVILK